MKGSDQLPFNTRHMENSGRYHGTGLKGKTGLKKGSFANQVPSKGEQKGKPPTKMV